jgi:hypothetical protein
MQINLRAIVHRANMALGKKSSKSRIEDSTASNSEPTTLSLGQRSTSSSPRHPDSFSPSARWPRKDRGCITNKPSLGRTAYGNTWK